MRFSGIRVIMICIGKCFFFIMLRYTRVCVCTRIQLRVIFLVNLYTHAENSICETKSNRITTRPFATRTLIYVCCGG